MLSHKQSDFFVTEDPCQNCNGKSRRLLSDIGRNFEKLETVICTDCGLIHSNPIPSKHDLDIFYNQKYRTAYKSAEKPKLKHTLRYASGALNRIKFLQKYIQPSQNILLDIGSGSGEFLYMALKSGFIGKGIEPHTGYACYTQKELGLPVTNQTLEQANLEEASVDIINLNHVLEHMQKPFDTLCYLNKILKPNGILMIDVPDISRANHSPWTQFHYAHIYNFNFDTLNAVLLKAGFEVLNPESKSTNLVARKIGFPQTANSINMQYNYEYLWDKLNKHTPQRHYTSITPYSRFFRKLFQYPYEFIMTQFIKCPKRILDGCFSKQESL